MRSTSQPITKYGIRKSRPSERQVPLSPALVSSGKEKGMGTCGRKWSNRDRISSRAPETRIRASIFFCFFVIRNPPRIRQGPEQSLVRAVSYRILLT